MNEGPVSIHIMRRLLRAYADYCSNDRTHLARDKDAPQGRAVGREDALRSRPILGGLHRRYYRKAGK
ncbi:MAG TPA: hypothetical protein PKD48_17850 [Sphingopyxis sp.]|nr:hypothetical protein [Sphingopyxis sp.]